MCELLKLLLTICEKNSNDLLKDELRIKNKKRSEFDKSIFLNGVIQLHNNFKSQNLKLVTLESISAKQIWETIRKFKSKLYNSSVINLTFWLLQSSNWNCTDFHRVWLRLHRNWIGSRSSGRLWFDFFAFHGIEWREHHCIHFSNHQSNQ